MGIGLDIEAATGTPEGWHALHAALLWQYDLGVTDFVQDSPVDRYSLTDAAPWQNAAPAAQTVSAQAAVTAGGSPRQTLAPQVQAAPAVDGVAAARAAAAHAADLPALHAALQGFDHCSAKRGARNLVFAEGLAGARVMVICDAPNREAEAAASPMLGAAAELFDRMFAAIGLGRQHSDAATALYTVPVMPWCPRPAQEMQPDDIAMMRPFLERHITLARPDIIVAMGHSAAQALLNEPSVTRIRGQWASAQGRPVLPMLHPALLLRDPTRKAEAWQDLLSLTARLRGT